MKNRNFKLIMDYFRNRFGYQKTDLNKSSTGDKIELVGSRPCFYSYAKDDKFGYATGSDGVHYCYGFCGAGFKFMPLHGKYVYEKLLKLKSNPVTLDMLEKATNNPTSGIKIPKTAKI